MKRKNWTPKTEITESLLQFREKRKWQIALRRYVLEESKCSYYAPFFGIGNEKFRNWIEIQFEEGINWSDFSKSWQFDHVVPIAYFDFNNEDDMYLCWNFTNIRVDKLIMNKNGGHRIDVLAAKAYFDDIYQNTGYEVCKKMIEKIERIEIAQLASNQALEQFIINNKSYLETIGTFTPYEFEKLNSGSDIESILKERRFLKKFGT